MAPPTTRRELLRAGAVAIGGFSSVRHATGQRATAASSPHEEYDDTTCDGVEARDGFLLFPERYRRCVRFQLVAELRVFRASVGRGSEVYQNDLREYTAYGIRYEEVEESTEDEQREVILAVPSPDHEESPSLFDYYLPRTRFRFTESKGCFVFQRNRSKPRTRVRRTEFVRVV
jgi:hypothetical protein